MSVTSNVQCEEDLLCGVNGARDEANMTDLERKHIPVITCPERIYRGRWFDVGVEVGKLLEHPHEPGHFVEFIELYADHTYLARMDFTARTTAPVMHVRLRLDHTHGKLRAFAHCNLHGTWEGQREIDVIQV
jgi:superoxide reductase